MPALCEILLQRLVIKKQNHTPPMDSNLNEVWELPLLRLNELSPKFEVYYNFETEDVDNFDFLGQIHD